MELVLLFASVVIAYYIVKMLFHSSAPNRGLHPKPVDGRKVIQFYVEKVDDGFCSYNKRTGEFLAQFKGKEDIGATMYKLFPDVVFVASAADIAVLGTIKELAGDVGMTLDTPAKQ